MAGKIRATVGIAVFLSFALPGVATASGTQQWNCRNTDFGIVCFDTGKCEVADSFTPMDITVSPDELSICAYSGCWEGKPIFAQSGPHIYARSESLKWSHNEKTAAFQLIVDTDSKLGMVLGDARDIVGVLHCAPH